MNNIHSIVQRVDVLQLAKSCFQPFSSAAGRDVAALASKFGRLSVSRVTDANRFVGQTTESKHAFAAARIVRGHAWYFKVRLQSLESLIEQNASLVSRTSSAVTIADSSTTVVRKGLINYS